MSSSETIYPEENLDFCVYLTSYYGLKMPPLYIGSTLINKIENKKYRGSVKSKEWKDIWKQELKEHPELFNTIILSRYSTRKKALEQELLLQKLFNVVKSPLFINKAFANKKFGMDAFAENNPMYGKIPHNKGKYGIFSPNYGFKHNEESKIKMSIAKTGKNNPNYGRCAEKHPMFGLTGELCPRFGKRLFIDLDTNERKMFIPGTEPITFKLKSEVKYL